MRVQLPAPQFGPGKRWRYRLAFAAGLFWGLGDLAASTRSAPGTNETSSAPPPAYTLKCWQTGDGLPQMTPTAITQTRDGYLWVGTFNGLARFDGVRFTSFTINNTEELLSDSIFALHEDQRGVLWIGTGEGGLARYDRGRFNRFEIGKEVSPLTVYAIREDFAGTLWVATSRGLCLISAHEQGNRASTELLLPGQAVIGVARGRDGEMWISTVTAIHRIAGKQIVESVRSTGEIHALATDAQGEPWVSYARRGGIGRLVPGSETLGITRWRTKVNSMHLAADGTLWAGTLSGTLWRLDSSLPEHYQNEAKLPKTITSVYADADGNVWAGVEAGGLWRVRKNTVAHLGKEKGLLTDAITSLRQDRQGRIWVGTFGKGLHFWNGEKFTPVRMPDAPNITSVLEDKNGKVWFGSYGGLLGWVEEEPTGWVPKLERAFGKRGRVLFEDASGGIWIGTIEAGIERVVNGNVTRYTVRDGLSSDSVRAIAQDSAGDIWVGTSGGLNRLRNGRIEQYHRKDGLAGEQVRVLFLDREGTLWIGSTGGGLTRWKEGQLQSIGVKQGLINDWIEQIIEDDHGHLWLGSNGGLMRVSLRELNDCISKKTPFVHCTVFRQEEGLSVPHCGTGFQPSSLKTSDGKLWFGSEAGIIVIDSAQIGSMEKAPPVYIEEMLVDQESKPIFAGMNPLQLKPGAQRLEFRYTGLDPSAAALVRFRHKLEGFDSDWVNAATQRDAVYTRVPPGQYRFRVLAANNHGSWNEEGASLAFSIQPYFWQTRVFQIGMPAFGLSAGGFLVWGLISRKHKRDLEMLERRHALERERSRIARDMHDGLGSSLVKISLLGEQAESRFAEADHAQPQIRKMTATARQVVREMDEIVWAVNPKNDTLENFAGYLGGFAREHFTDTAVECHLDLPARVPAQPLRAEVRHNLFLAVREALNNVLKHSGAQHVWVRLEINHHALEIVVRDDGRGFSPAFRTQGNGLDNMRQRLEQIGGQMKLEQDPQGTTVYFQIPLDQDPRTTF